MDGPCNSNQIQKCLLLENQMTGAVAHTVEDAAKVLRTKFESSGTSTLVVTERSWANEHTPFGDITSLASETSTCCLVSPLNPKHFPFVQISSLSALPKKHKSNKWRLTPRPLLSFLLQSGFQRPKNYFFWPRNTASKNRH